MTTDPLLRREVDRVRESYQQASGLLVDPESLAYANQWLRAPDPRLPQPNLRTWYREPTGLYLPLSCVITLVNTTKKIAATTDPVDFAGCHLTGAFVALVGIFDAATFSDSSGNSWTLDGTYGALGGGAGGTFRTYYCVHPTATGSHTFSYGGGFYSIVVFGFANIDAFDQMVGAAGPVVQPGSLTPTVDGSSLFVAGYGGGDIVTATVDSPFGGTEVSNDYGAAVNYSSAGSYFIQGASGAQNPTWSKASGSGAASLLVFKATVGASVPNLRVGYSPAVRLN